MRLNLFSIILLGGWCIALTAQQLDETSGLIIADGFEVVNNNCTLCHSADNILQNAGSSRSTWLDLIRWMQTTQGLKTFEPAVETEILDYLETYYGPTQPNHSSSLVVAEGFEVVERNCTSCHSAAKIIEKAASPRLTWLGLIRWMQQTKGLKTFDSETETTILDYLETHYGPTEVDDRRTLLAADQKPPNPYTTRAHVSFAGLAPHYRLGDTLSIDLMVEDFPDYSQGRFDLWVAVQLPDTPAEHFYFLVDSLPEFTLAPQALLNALKPQNQRYALLESLELTAIQPGTYTFYALLVEHDANPFVSTERVRSELAIQTTEFE